MSCNWFVDSWPPFITGLLYDDPLPSSSRQVAYNYQQTLDTHTPTHLAYTVHYIHVYEHCSTIYLFYQGVHALQILLTASLVQVRIRRKSLPGAYNRYTSQFKTDKQWDLFYKYLYGIKGFYQGVYALQIMHTASLVDQAYHCHGCTMLYIPNSGPTNTIIFTNISHKNNY